MRRVWSTLRPSCQSREHAITLKPKWLLIDSPWSSLLMLLVDWGGRPASLPLWRMCSEKLHRCQVSNWHDQIKAFIISTGFIFNIYILLYSSLPTPVALERRRDGSSRQYSVEAELLLPGVVGTRMLGLMEQKGSLWSSALRLKCGLGGEWLKNIHHKAGCHMTL